MLPTTPEAFAAQCQRFCADACTAAKQSAIGKEAAALLDCHAKAAKKGVAVDSSCLAKANAAYVKAFVKADAAGGCLTTGDAADAESSMGAFVDDVVAALRPALTASKPTA